MDLDLRLIRYFVAVADELHFGRASARLHLSQPSLSKQIRKLEAQIGEPLLIRDSRHVSLTNRGTQFLDEARNLLAIAARMQRPNRDGRIRIAHIFELDTSRQVADAFARARPDSELLEHAMDSYAQLDAVLENRLDVAMIRVTPRMFRDRPTGWRYRLVRLEPFLLVGGPHDHKRSQASLVEHPMSVFCDPLDSGSYTALGEYVSELERDTGVSMRWLGTTGAFSNCMAQVARMPEPSRHLEFFSYARRYADAGLPIYAPVELQPYYPWSLVWRDEDATAETSDLLAIAEELAERQGWLIPWDGAVAAGWLPERDPFAATFNASAR